MKGFILLLTCLLSVQSMIAQTSQFVEQSTNILPPSPTAGELGKYGLAPVGLVTGTASVSIPIFEYKVKNQSVPISLSYSSNGLKVDQVSSWVGHSWSLNANGVITRIIRDEPDPINNDPYPEDFSVSNAEALTYLDNASREGFDSEQDLFSFNFMGRSGKFVYDRSGKTIIMPHANIIIEWIQQPTGNFQDYFKVTTEDGTQYFFESVEVTYTQNQGSGCPRDYTGSIISSWFLTRIVNTLGETVHFEYAGWHSYSYPVGISQSMTGNTFSSGDCMGDCPQFGAVQTCKAISVVRSEYLKRIWSEGFGSVEFNASLGRLDLNEYKLDEIVVKDINNNIVRRFSLSYEFPQGNANSNVYSGNDTRYRMYLMSITEKDISGVGNRKHFFEYYDLDKLPPRLSYSQDHWGYYNGASNQYLVPRDESQMVGANGQIMFANIGGDRNSYWHSYKGLLKKVTFPTGGYSELIYSPNSYFGKKKISASETQINLGVTGQEDMAPVTKKIQIRNLVAQKIILTGSASINPHVTGYTLDERHNFATITIRNLTTNTSVQLPNTRILPGESMSVAVNLVEGQEYVFSVTARGEIVTASLLGSYIAQPPKIIDADITIGGVRVSQVKNFDPITSTTEIKKYTYERINVPSQSSGQVRNSPSYLSPFDMNVACALPCQVKLCQYMTLNSSSVHSLYPVDGSNIYYESVIVSRGEGSLYGAEEHQFYISSDAQPRMVWGAENMNGAPLTNYGWDNGLEKQVNYYALRGKNLTLVKNTFNHYKTDSRNYQEVPNLIVRSKGQPTCEEQYIFICDENNINYKKDGIICTAQHDHKWLRGRWERPLLCIAPNAQNENRRIDVNPCYQKQVGEQILNSHALRHLNALEYRNIGYWYYLDFVSETLYDENGTNGVSTNRYFYYDNALHGQVSQIKERGINEAEKITTIKYPSDYEVALENFATLTDKHILNTPVKTHVTMRGKITEGQIVKYLDSGLPKEVYQYAGPNVAPTGFSPQNVDYTNYFLNASLRYDGNTGNLIDIMARKTPAISYKWSYANTKVVARIEGASSDEVYYSSFEDTGISQGGTSGPVAAKSGSRWLNSGSYTISPGEFNPTDISALVMSYWYYEGGQWKFSGEIPYTSTILRGIALDEIRVYPKGSLITTVSYDLHFDRVMSVMDPNGQQVSYEYDSYGALKRTLDDKGNIVKEFKYQYYNQD